MHRYEYKVVPAPERGKKGKTARTPEARFANALELVMNELAEEGWEYHRAETLPSEERTGLTSRHTVYRNLLVFRRALPLERTEAPVPGHTEAAPVTEPPLTVREVEVAPEAEAAKPTRELEEAQGAAGPTADTVRKGMKLSATRLPDTQPPGEADAAAIAADAAARAAATLRRVGSAEAKGEPAPKAPTRLSVARAERDLTLVPMLGDLPKGADKSASGS